jgi:hypothetical protein
MHNKMHTKSTKKFTQNEKKTQNAKNDMSFRTDILPGGGEVISYWCVAFTILFIPDIIAIFWNRLEGLVCVCAGEQACT